MEFVWDPAPVLTQLQGWGPIHGLTYRQLTQRTMLLFLMATGQRLQALHLMSRYDFEWDGTYLKITYSTKTKSNNPDTNPLVLAFREGPDETLCVFSHLRHYTAHQLSRGAEPYVFSTVRPPTHRASAQTVSKYVKDALQELGVGEQFSAYSSRHASTSMAARAAVPTQKILNSAGWASETTFSRFYNRPLQPRDTQEETNFLPYLLNN